MVDWMLYIYIKLKIECIWNFDNNIRVSGKLDNYDAEL